MSGIDDVRASFADIEDVDLPEGLIPDEGFAPPAVADDEAPPMPDDTGPGVERDCAVLPLNDLGNGRRLQAHFGSDLLWVPRVAWHVWDGARWKADHDEIAVRRVAQELGPKIAAEIPHVRLSDVEMARLAERSSVKSRLTVADAADPKDKGLVDRIAAELAEVDGLAIKLQRRRDRHASHAVSTGNSGRIDSAIKEAGIGLARALDDLDADPLVVNTASATLRFRVSGGGSAGYSRTADVEVLDHDRAHLLSKMAAVAYDPRAGCPAFDGFIVEVMPNAAVRGFLQRWMGLSMLGVREQRLVFNYGGGANGKSVFVDLMARILGDYSATAKIESLTGKNRRSGGDATPDLVPLIGARMVRSSEPEEGERLAESKIKELTGGEPILVRALNADFIEVNPYFKLTISGNHKPEIRGTDDGIWRRVSLVPWDVTIPPERRDVHLGEKLFAEAPGILNWLIEGAIAFLEGGLQEPDEVKTATQEFREESDPVGAFLVAACLVTGSENDSIGARELGEAFNYWLSEKGEGMWKPRTVALRLKDKAARWKSPAGRGFVVRKASTMAYDGIRLNDTFRAKFDARPKDRRAEPPAQDGDDYRGAF